jgi:hypothetical protein
MRRRHTAQSAFLNLCIFFGLLVFFAGVLLALFASASPAVAAHLSTASIAFIDEKEAHPRSGKSDL